MKKKYGFITILFFALLVLTPLISSSQTRMETEIPIVNQQEWATRTSQSELPLHIQNIINILSIFAGVVAFLSLAYGGVLWITSSGEPLKMQQSKSRMIHALVGLVLVIGAVTIANSINPTIVTITPAPTQEVTDFERSGVYLSLSNSFYEEDDQVEERMEAVRRIDNSERIIGSFVDNTYRRREECTGVWQTAEDTRCSGSRGTCCYREGTVKKIRIANPTIEEGNTFLTAVVLHSKEGFDGDCQIYFNDNTGEDNRNMDIDIPSNIGENISSISIIRVPRDYNNPYGYVSFWDKPRFQGQQMSTNNFVPTLTSVGEFSVTSIDIEGSYAVILASGNSWGNMPDGCVVFQRARPVDSLVNHPMNQCNPYFVTMFWAANRSCATHYAVFPRLESR